MIRSDCSKDIAYIYCFIMYMYLHISLRYISEMICIIIVA